jgi:cell pole-organizing protein PopZ
MEEILASIRQIISEDGESSPGSKDDVTRSPAPAESSALVEAGPAPYETVVSSLESEPVSASPRSTTQSYVEVARAPQAAPPAGEPMEDRTPTPMPRSAALARRPAHSEEQQGGGLLSPEKSAAVSGAFGTLTHSLLGQNARTLEDLVAEMLQPMLKSWLDDNLPGLVERMVQEEIERVSRGRR